MILSSIIPGNKASKNRKKSKVVIYAMTAVFFMTFGSLLSQKSLLLPLASDLHFSNIVDHTVVPAASTIDTEVVMTTTEGQEKQDKKIAAEYRLQRMKMYKERYKYEPPKPYDEHGERDKICGVGPDYDTYFSMVGTNERSANEEDRTIYELLFKPGVNDTIVATRGTIVEMGAFNGIRESNSRFYDICLGWDTLLIEGNPGKWAELVDNRPHSHRLSFAPSCSEEDELMNKTVKFYQAAFTNAALADGSVTSAYANGDKDKMVDVPCGSLTKVLLDIFPGGHVSFFSLDVEGAEPYVLENIDFDKVFIEVFIVENFNSFCQKECETRDKFRQIMNDNGYILFRGAVKKSDLFIHPLSEHLETMRKKGIEADVSSNPTM